MSVDPTPLKALADQMSKRTPKTLEELSALVADDLAAIDAVLEDLSPAAHDQRVIEALARHLDEEVST
jgi:hypothetical protein